MVISETQGTESKTSGQQEIPHLVENFIEKFWKNIEFSIFAVGVPGNKKESLTVDISSKFYSLTSIKYRFEINKGEYTLKNKLDVKNDYRVIKDYLKDRDDTKKLKIALDYVARYHPKLFVTKNLKITCLRLLSFL